MRLPLNTLEQHAWPGNIRELAHVIERAVTLSDGEWIEAVDFGLKDSRQSERPGTQPVLGDTFDLETITQRLVMAALKRGGGQKNRAADLLGVHPRTLTRMMRRYGLAEADGEAEPHSV